MVCFKANFLLQENKILSYFLKEKGLHSIWQSKAVHSKLGVQGETNWGNHAVSCWTCSLSIIRYIIITEGTGCCVYTWRRLERYLGAEPAITLKQTQHALHLMLSSAEGGYFRRITGIPSSLVTFCGWLNVKLQELRNETQNSLFVSFPTGKSNDAVLHLTTACPFIFSWWLYSLQLSCEISDSST